MVWVSVQPAPAAASGALDENTARIFAEAPGDPALAGPSATAYATCGQLLAYPDEPFPQGSHLRPEVARAMPEVTDGGRTYTYRLRHGFRFSPPSNQPVTADAFRRAIERSLDPRMHSYGLELLSDVVGYRAYEAGRARHLAGVVARGDVLTIRLTAPSPTFPARLAAVYFCAVPPNTPVDPGGIDAIPSAGRYYVASSDPDGAAMLKRNPGYGGEHPGRLAEIDLLPEVPQAEAIADVEAGRADLLDLSPQESGARRIQTEYGPGGPQAASRRYLSTPTLTLHYLALNTDREPFSDVRVRRAANYAIDRRALVRQPLPEVSGRPTDQYIPPGMPGFQDAIIYPLGGPDVAKARRLAPAEHGTAVMYTCNDDSCRHNAEVVRANLKRIGIDVRIHQFPYAALYHRLLAPLKAGRTGPWDIADVGWINDYADPQGELNPLFEVGHAGDGSNFGHFDDARFQRDLQHAAALSGPRRDRAFTQLDAALARDAAPVIAYANETTDYFFSARIGCQVVQPLYGLDLAALCMRP
jgi:peptide/nickel transport system substrate-binding protein